MNTAELMLLYQLQNMNQAWQDTSKSENGNNDNHALLFAALLQSALSEGDGFGSSTGLVLEAFAGQGLGFESGQGQFSPENAQLLAALLSGNLLSGESSLMPGQNLSRSTYNPYANIADALSVNSLNSNLRLGYRADKPEIEAMIAEVAQRHGLDSNLIRQVVIAESSFDSNAVSSAGAMGLMQLMPGTAKTYGVSDPFDPAQNLDGGTRFLKDLLIRFKGNLSFALAGYNAGPGAVDKYNGIPPYKETQNYVKKILTALGKVDTQA